MLVPSTFSYKKNYKNSQKYYTYGSYYPPKLGYDVENAVTKVLEK